MQEGRGQEGPEEVDEEGEGGGQVEREAVVLVGGDFWGGARDGFGGAVAGG